MGCGGEERHLGMEVVAKHDFAGACCWFARGWDVGRRQGRAHGGGGGGGDVVVGDLKASFYRKSSNESVHEY